MLYGKANKSEPYTHQYPNQTLPSNSLSLSIRNYEAIYIQCNDQLYSPHWGHWHSCLITANFADF